MADSPDFLTYQRKLNTFLAMPLYTTTLKPFGGRLGTLPMIVYQRLSEIIVVTITIGQFWAVPHISEDMNVLCGCLSSSSHCWQVILKTICLQIYKDHYTTHFKKISTLQREINELEKLVFRRDVSEFIRYHIQQSRYVRVIATVQLLVNFFSTSAYFLPFVYDSIVNDDELDRQLTPIVVYIGMDINFTPVFQIVVVTLTVGFFIVNLKSVVIDNFILNIIVLHMSQLKHHNSILKEIQIRMKSEGGRDRGSGETLKTWIRQHQTMLCLHEDFQKLISPYLALEFSYIFFHTCVPAFVITSTFSWTFPQKVAVFFMVGGGITTLFLMSYASDSFTNAWQETGAILFDSEVVPKNEAFLKHMYLLIQMRLQRPFRFSAFNVLPLSCSTFLTIVRLIVSYYVTLGQFQKMKHG